MKTISTIAQAKKAPPGVYSVKNAEGVGFKKQSEAEGTGGFTFRFWLGDKRPTMGLGSPGDFESIEAVRDAADAARKLVRKGINPIEERKRRKAANLAAVQPVTFKQKAEAVRDVYTPTLKGKYAVGNWFNPIARHVLPLVGDLPINDVEPRHIGAVLAALDAKGLSKTGPRLRAHIAMIFNAAIASGDRTGGNPADAHLIRAMRPGTGKSDDEHYRRPELADAPLAIAALRKAREAIGDTLMSGISTCSLLAAALDAWLVMASTALRPGEALKMQWSEVDFEKRLATIAAPRMKGRKGKTKPHIVPLSTLALEVLERRRRLRIGDNENVFPGPNGAPPSHTFFAKAPARVGLDLGAPHSWRSIFADWSGEIGDIAPDLREAALAHRLTAVQAAYRRGSSVEPRRAVMESYGRWLTGDTDSNVIAMTVRAA